MIPMSQKKERKRKKCKSRRVWEDKKKNMIQKNGKRMEGVENYGFHQG